MRAFPQKDKAGIYLSGEVEVPKGRTAQLTSADFKIVSLTGNRSLIENLKGFKSNYVVRNENGQVVGVEERKFEAVDTLNGDTHRASGFWGMINGDYSQRFFYSMSVNGFSENSFRVYPPDILINQKKYQISSIDFNLVTKTIFVSPCP